MKAIARTCLMTIALLPLQALALSLGEEEFAASRKVACVMAQQSLGRLTEKEYGDMTHSVLDDFDEEERDNILAQAVGYYDGLIFTAENNGSKDRVNLKLEDYVTSSTCAGGFRKVMLTL